MVRTRGLGRALGRGIGRGQGGQDEYHADDVPWRRRPTASVCRQWVHVSVAEDVADMTEDVPLMTTDVPTTRVEGLASDVAIGSVADDAEGFPGGPRDPSMLTLFAEHVAHNIWSGKEHPELKLVSHERKVEKFGRSASEIAGLVATTRLTPLIECSVVTGDPGVISAFVERWHRETSTFHLPLGEVTITLDDVGSLLHLPITGAFQSFELLLMDEAVVLLVELLEVLGEEAKAETARVHGAYVRLSWLGDIYLRRCEAGRWIVAARAYLLHLGAVALVHMYDQLNEASQSSRRQIARYLTLLQINEHFPSVHDCVIDDAYNETSPRAYRWLTMKAYMKGLPAALYQTCLDALTITDVCWMPYGDHQGVRGFDLISCFQGQLRWGPIMVTVRPERVVSIDYMEWFFQISHPFVTLTQEGDEHRHPPAPQHEEYVEPGIPEVLVGAEGGLSHASDPPRHVVDGCEGCEAIAERLERVLNLRMVTEGTELHEIMEDCLRISMGDTSNGNVRARRRRRTDHSEIIFGFASWRSCISEVEQRCLHVSEWAYAFDDLISLYLSRKLSAAAVSIEFFFLPPPPSRPPLSPSATPPPPPSPPSSSLPRLAQRPLKGQNHLRPRSELETKLTAEINQGNGSEEAFLEEI
ncbi:uncharacterized protein LOC114386034 [Glycine soja]|uniref:uncharacterized protein LOC114386034 n=1 Tax=Glycine soja TaxID=3848 RepID=UPI001039582F|nr:uncharacterized protein LOC114386034 [Glycine soja]